MKIIGYTQGTFDMFHIGHLNLIRNAKKECDYLIVGVNSDKLVEEYKGHKPIISQEDRLAIIDALRYVDEVIITDTLDKMVSWDKFHYNRIFIGDDWKGNTRWKKTEEVLSSVNVKLVYLPYTKNISSSQIRNTFSNDKS